MEYTIVADPHLKPTNLDIVSQLFNLVEGLGRPVIWAGDMLDSKEVIRGRCLNLVYRYLKNSKLKHTLLVGNHEKFVLDEFDHSLAVLEELENVDIIAEGLTTNDGTLGFLPYEHDLNQFKNCLKIMADRKPAVLFLHQGINGFDYGNGHIEENGINVEDLPKLDLIISGHFHKRQEIDDGRIVYLGSPFSHSFGETNQTKYIAILDTNTKQLEYIETPFPRHWTEDLDVNDSKALEQMEKLQKKHKNNHLRVNLVGDESNIALFDRNKFPHIKFIDKPTNADNTNVAISETSSNEEKFIKWAKEIKELDKETMDLGLEILGEL